MKKKVQINIMETKSLKSQVEEKAKELFELAVKYEGAINQSFPDRIPEEAIDYEVAPKVREALIAFIDVAIN